MLYFITGEFLICLVNKILLMSVCANHFIDAVGVFKGKSNGKGAQVKERMDTSGGSLSRLLAPPCYLQYLPSPSISTKNKQRQERDRARYK
jgi:hypothetical protein